MLNLGQQVTLVQEVSLNLVQRREDLGEEDLSSPVLQELVLVQEDLLNLVLLELEDLAIQVDQVHLVDLTKF